LDMMDLITKAIEMYVKKRRIMMLPRNPWSSSSIVCTNHKAKQRSWREQSSESPGQILARKSKRRCRTQIRTNCQR
jgi:hypothetical protein